VAAGIESLSPRRAPTKPASTRSTRLSHHPRPTPAHPALHARGQRRHRRDPHPNPSVPAIASRRSHPAAPEHVPKRSRHRRTARRRRAHRRKPFSDVAVGRAGLQTAGRRRVKRLHVRHRFFHAKRRRRGGRRQIRRSARERLRGMTRNRSLQSLSVIIVV
jgi:hypothetical protein